MADEEPLRRLEEGVGAATEAACRLLSEARGGGGGGSKPPPAGWQAPPEERRHLPELEALVNAVSALRDLIPPDVADRLAAAIKEVLLALRALVDYWLERIDRKPQPPAEVQDIPID